MVNSNSLFISPSVYREKSLPVVGNVATGMNFLYPCIIITSYIFGLSPPPKKKDQDCFIKNLGMCIREHNILM